jgi:hypothetical protein
MRYAAKPARSLLLIVLLVLSASPSLAQTGLENRTSFQSAPLFYDRVAEILDIAPELVKETVTGPVQEALEPRVIVALLILAKRRADRQLVAGTTTTEAVLEIFRNTMQSGLAGDAKKWQRMAEADGIPISDLTRQARAIVHMARHVDQPEPQPASREMPEELSRLLSQRFTLRPETLAEAWGLVEDTTKKGGHVYLKPAVMLLVLALEKTEQSLRVRTVSPAEREGMFLRNLGYFKEQSRNGVGWGDLAIQVNASAGHVNREANALLSELQRRELKKVRATEEEGESKK